MKRCSPFFCFTSATEGAICCCPIHLVLKQNNKISVRYFPSATLACNCNISQHAVSRPRRHHHHQSGPFMSSAIYFLSHAHWLCLQHLSQLSALLRLFCFSNKILQLHIVASNRRRQRSAQHVPHLALASFAPAASTCKIKQNAAALCNANMIATHCTNTSHSNRRTPYVRARRPQIPASNNSGQSARGSTAQCYLQLADLNASAAVLVQPLASTHVWMLHGQKQRRKRVACERGAPPSVTRTNSAHWGATKCQIAADPAHNFNFAA